MGNLNKILIPRSVDPPHLR